MYLSHKTDYCLNPKDIFFLTLDSTKEGRSCTSSDNGIKCFGTNFVLFIATEN